MDFVKLISQKRTAAAQRERDLKDSNVLQIMEIKIGKTPTNKDLLTDCKGYTQGRRHINI